MKFPEALESRMYGNPEDVLAAKQAAEANRKKRASEREAIAPKRRTLTVRKGWAARKAVESLFAGSGAVSAVLSPALPAMEVDPE